MRTIMIVYVNACASDVDACVSIYGDHIYGACYFQLLALRVFVFAMSEESI